MPEEESSNVTVNSQEQVDGSGNGRGATEAPVADSAPAEQGAEEEDTQSSEYVCRAHAHPNREFGAFFTFLCRTKL